MPLTVILATFPLLAVAVPYVMQFVKPFIEQTFAPQYSEYHDIDLKIATCLVSGITGLIILYYTGHPIATLQDAIALFAVFVAYSLGGGILAMNAYSFLNKGVPQTDPTGQKMPFHGVNKITNLAGEIRS